MMHCYANHFFKNTYLNGSKNFNIVLKKVSDRLMVKKLKLNLNLNKTRSVLLHLVKNNFWKNINLNVKIGKTVIKMINIWE